MLMPIIIIIILHVIGQCVHALIWHIRRSITAEEAITEATQCVLTND